MRERDNPWFEWTGRIVGGIVVASIAYFSMSVFSMWDHLPMKIHLGVAGLIGVLFVAFGKCIWSWIDRITDWT